MRGEIHHVLELRHGVAVAEEFVDAVVPRHGHARTRSGGDAPSGQCPCDLVSGMEPGPPAVLDNNHCLPP